jgi:hypothetical protein
MGERQRGDRSIWQRGCGGPEQRGARVASEATVVAHPVEVGVCLDQGAGPALGPRVRRGGDRERSAGLRGAVGHDTDQRHLDRDEMSRTVVRQIYCEYRHSIETGHMK